MDNKPNVTSTSVSADDDLQPVWDMLREPVITPPSVLHQLQALSHTNRDPLIRRLLPSAWLACTLGLVGMFASLWTLLTRLPQTAYSTALDSVHLDPLLAASNLLLTFCWTVMPWLAVGVALTYAAPLIRLTRR